MGISQIVFIVVGVLTILMGITKIGFQTRKAQRTVKLIGEGGTQVLYIVIGIFVVIASFFV